VSLLLFVVVVFFLFLLFSLSECSQLIKHWQCIWCRCESVCRKQGACTQAAAEKVKTEVRPQSKSINWWSSLASFSVSKASYYFCCLYSYHFLH